MTANPYLIPGTDCLKNLLGITDKDDLAKAEAEKTSARLAVLTLKADHGKLDYKHLKAIHKSLFEGIYDWAGKERTVQTVKGFSRFEWPENIQKEANKLFAELSEENYLKNMERSEFIERAAHYYSELNVIHPFPEGNGRAQQALFTQIAKEAGHNFNWGQTTKDQMIEAVIHAYAIDNSKLEAVFEQMLVVREKSIERNKTTEIDLAAANPIRQSDYIQATETLRKKATELTASLRHDANKKIEALQKKINILDKNIQAHIERKPKSYLTPLKPADPKHIDWDHKKKVLTAERDNLFQHLESAKSGRIHEHTEKALITEANKLAKDALPTEAKLVKGFEADETINLISKNLRELDQSIDKARSGGDTAKDLPKLLKEKTRILNKIKFNKSLSDRISASGKSAVNRQSTETKSLLSRFEDRSLDRSR